MDAMQDSPLLPLRAPARTNVPPVQGTITRRALLDMTLGALGAAALSRVAWSPPRLCASAVQPFLVLVNLRGGNDGLNTVVPVNLQTYHEARPLIGIQPQQALSLAAGPRPTNAFALHPSLKQTAGLWAKGELALLHRVGYPNPSLSHFQSEDVWSLGARNTNGTSAGRGWIARYHDLYGMSPLGVIGIGTGGRLDFLGAKSPLTLLERVNRWEFDTDEKWRPSSRHAYELIETLLHDERAGAAGEVARAMRDSREVLQKLRGGEVGGPGQFPATTLGRHLQQVGIALDNDYPTRIFYVATTATPGFDTHSKQLATQAGLFDELDAALGALASDLRQRGHWQQAVVAVFSEFGRRTPENGFEAASSGTDHGEGSCVMLMGGALRGGVHGPVIEEHDLLPGSLPYAVDFRSIWSALLERHLGVDAAAVFDEPFAKTSLDLMA